jgi:hypothetical protein
MEKIIDGKTYTMVDSESPCDECCFGNGDEPCSTKDRECLEEKNEYKCWKEHESK